MIHICRGCVCVWDMILHNTKQQEVITILTVSQMVKMFCLVWHPKVDNHNHKRALFLARFMYSLHTPQFFKIHFNIILPSMPPSQGFFFSPSRFAAYNSVHTSHLPHTCYTCLPRLTLTYFNEGKPWSFAVCFKPPSSRFLSLYTSSHASSSSKYI